LREDWQKEIVLRTPVHGKRAREKGGNKKGAGLLFRMLILMRDTDGIWGEIYQIFREMGSPIM